MTEKAPVTVVIPCWNDGVTLPSAVRSVVDQTLPPERIIIVDDASSDDSREVIGRLQRQVSSIEVTAVFLPQNIGPGPARNIAWQLATTRYLAFLDADDVWYPHKLATQMKVFESHPEIVALGAQSSQAAQTEQRETCARPGIKSFEVSDMLWSNRLPTRTVVVRRECDERFGTRDEAEDFLLWLRLAHRYGSVERVEEVLASSLPRAAERPSLTSQLWTHGIREQRSFWAARREGIITAPQWVFASSFALAKLGARQMGWRRGG